MRIGSCWSACRPVADTWQDVAAEARVTIRNLTIVVWVLVLLAIVLFVAALLLWGAYWRLRNMVEMGCDGTLARLDLTATVDMCREVMGVR